MTKKEKETLKSLGSRIKSMREQRGWSRYMLAKYSKVQAQWIKMIEDGDMNSRYLTLKRLEDAFCEKI